MKKQKKLYQIIDGKDRCDSIDTVLYDSKEEAESQAEDMLEIGDWVGALIVCEVKPVTLIENIGMRRTNL